MQDAVPVRMYRRCFVPSVPVFPESPRTSFMQGYYVGGEHEATADMRGSAAFEGIQEFPKPLAKIR
jgi:hypothetical protein